jgi:hypothetical protein
MHRFLIVPGCPAQLLGQDMMGKTGHGPANGLEKQMMPIGPFKSLTLAIGIPNLAKSFLLYISNKRELLEGY